MAVFEKMLTSDVLRYRKRSSACSKIRFDASWYLESNPDVRDSGVAPFRHYTKHGRVERRSPHPLFNAEWYLQQNAESRKDLSDPFGHYIRYGRQEGRSPHPLFDVAFYKKEHAQDPTALADPLDHYLRHGSEEGFDPNPFFDNGWYASRNALGLLSSLEHFIRIGNAEGVAGHPLWDEHEYCKSNPDISCAVEARVFNSGYQHFVMYGRHEIIGAANISIRRFTFTCSGWTSDFDERMYLEDNVDVKVAIERGVFDSGLAHFFKRGFWECKEGVRAVYAAHRWAKLQKTIDGHALPLNKRLCLFAHYDIDGIIDEHVIYSLRALRGLECDIIFVTSTDDQSEIGKVLSLCRNVLVKNDAGRDFQSWRLAYDWFGEAGRSEYEQILLVNDSCYFPVNNPEILFRFENMSKFDFWGITDTHDLRQYHIQSFFTGFGVEAQKTLLPDLMAFVRQRPVLTKQGQIIDFELGFTRRAQEAGLSVGALCPIDDVREDIIKDPRFLAWRSKVQMSLENLNPTLRLWDLLIAYYGCPILKVQLLRENPTLEPRLEQWPQVIDPKYLPARLIKAHQDRLRGVRSAGTKPLRGRGASSVAVMQEDHVAVREVLPGRGFGNGRDLVLLAHYDPDGMLDPHVEICIKGLQRVGCDVVTITASQDAVAVAKMRDLSAAVVLKNELGRDFGSWYAGTRALREQFNLYESIIWINDSIYFPLFDPSEMFESMRGRNLDLWGVVDSHFMRWHLMSWFWAFGPRANREGFFDWYAREYNPTYTKWSQIKNYEMRIPQMLRARGYSVGSFIEAIDVRRHLVEQDTSNPYATRRLDFTMTHQFWDLIITQFRCPALKVELLRDNPLGIDISGAYDLISRATDYDAEMIRGHISRLKTGHLRQATSMK